MEYFFQTPSESAGFIRNLLEERIRGLKSCAVVLSGGRSIKPVLAAVGELSKEDLSACTFYLADERIGGDYNQIMLMEEGPFRKEQCIFPDIEKPAEEAAAEYEKMLSKFDIAFLGVGEDGHVASLFPGHAALVSPRSVTVVPDSPKPPSKRITLTFRAFSRDTTVVLLFFGEGKRDAFECFHKERSYHKCPAAYFKQGSPPIIIHNQGSQQ